MYKDQETDPGCNIQNRINYWRTQKRLKYAKRQTSHLGGEICVVSLPRSPKLTH